MIRAVVFDFAGVLTTSPFEGLSRYEDDLGYPGGTLRALMLGDYGAHASDHPWHRLERGEMTLHEFWADLVTRADAQGTPIELAEFLRSFGSGVRAHDGMLAVARGLRPGYRTAILTNNVREYGDLWRSMVDAETSFDHLLDSSELGMRKPQPEIFVHACEVLGVDPVEAVFLDDHDENVAGAVAVGMRGIQVRVHEEAIVELRALLEGEGASGWPEDGEAGPN